MGVKILYQQKDILKCPKKSDERVSIGMAVLAVTRFLLFRMR